MRPKPQTRNALSEHIMSYLKTHRTMVKTIHAAPKDSSEDLSPFLPYSMNKRKRWEISENYLNFLEKTQHHPGDSRVMLLERVRTCPYDWPRHYDTILHEQFKVRVVHRLVLDSNDSSDSHQKPIYEKVQINSIYGQDLKNLMGENEPSEDIAYHFLDTPANYITIFRKKCIRKKDDDWPDTTGCLREKRWKAIQVDLKYSDDFPDEDVDVEFNVNDEEIKDITSQPKKFYNFMDHVVDKSRNK